MIQWVYAPVQRHATHFLLDSGIIYQICDSVTCCRSLFVVGNVADYGNQISAVQLICLGPYIFGHKNIFFCQARSIVLIPLAETVNNASGILRGTDAFIILRFTAAFNERNGIYSGYIMPAISILLALNPSALIFF